MMANTTSKSSNKIRIETCRPHRLPIKGLKWQRLISLIGDAREAVARLDSELNQTPNAPAILEPLSWLEAMSSLRSQNIHATLLEVLTYKNAQLATEKRAALLEKILLAKEGLDAGIRWARNRKIGIHFFCRAHSFVKKNGPKPQDIGHLRNRQNWIGQEGCRLEDAYFYPPAASRIHPLLRNLETYLAKKDLDALVQLSIGFAQFLIIHPFMDGNGRVARIMIPVFALKKKLMTQPALFLSAYFEANRLDYFQKLFWISEKQAWEDWIDYFLKGVISQANHTRDRVIRLKKLWQKVESIVDKDTTRKIFMEPLIAKEKIQNASELEQQKILIAQGEFWLFAPLIRAIRK